jgi:transposase
LLLILSPLGRQCEKDHVYTWMLHYYVEGFFMAKKGTTFNTYSNEIKLSAVQSYLNGEGSYDMIAKKYQIRSSTQLKNWVKKYKERGEITDTRGENNKTKGIPNPL